MKTILLIEDNLEIRENTAEILELANYKVHTAENGKLGVEMAKRISPDLIICDIMMPELDGYGVLHMLSKNTATAAIPFIFLTAKAEKDDFRKGMNLGADDYLSKPFDDLALLDAVEMRFKKNAALKSEFKKTLEGLDDLMTQAKGEEELSKLVSDKRKVNQYPKRQVIFNQNTYPNFLYFINKGKVKTFKTNDLGNELITGLYNEGDFFGYIDLLENVDYTESAGTLEDSEICMIPKQEFFSLIYSNRDIANKFIKILSNNLAEREERLIQLAYNSVRKRVAESLLLLQQKYEPENSKFSIAISRDDLGSLVGASKETVTRMLTDFKEEKIIEIKGSNIAILNKEKLLKMKN